MEEVDAVEIEPVIWRRLGMNQLINKESSERYHPQFLPHPSPFMQPPSASATTPSYFQRTNRTPQIHPSPDHVPQNPNMPS